MAPEVLTWAESADEAYKLLVDAMDDFGYGFAVANSSRQILYANRSFCEIVGYSLAELAALPTFEVLISPGEREKVAEYNRRRLSGAPATEHYETVFARKDGGQVDVEGAIRTLVTGAGTFVMALIRDISPRKASEVQLHTTLVNLRAADAQRRRLLDSLVQAQEEERRRIASDVHDDSIQAIAALRIRLSLLAERLTDPTVAAEIKESEDLALASIERLRRLIFHLRPPALDREGLVGALEEYAAEWQREPDAPSIEIDSTLQGDPGKQCRVILFRVAQEAMVNIKKHARASRVVISLQPRDGGTVLTLSDDGMGFTAEERLPTAVGHLGLIAMRERAEMAGGSFRINSEPGSGTTVEVWVPELEEPGSGADGRG